MKEERILHILGQIDDKYVEEADPVKPIQQTKRRRKGWKYAGIAALLSCVLCFSILWVPKEGGLTAIAQELGQEEYEFGVSLPKIIYADAQTAILYDFRGIYVYSFIDRQLAGYADFRPIHMTTIQGDDPTFVEVSQDGQTVKFYNSKANYIFDVEGNITEKVDNYHALDQRFLAHQIEELPPDAPENLEPGYTTYRAKDGSYLAVTLDRSELREGEAARYKNLVIQKKTGSQISEYHLFQTE